MLQNLSIEWLKLKNYRTFWILSGLYLFSIVGINFIAFRIQQAIYNAKEAKGMAQMVLGSTPYSFPVTWQMTSYMTSFLLFIPGLIMIICVTNEYSYKTHRQNIIDGWNRREFILVKIVLAVLISLASTIMVIISAAIFGFADGNGDFSFDNFYYTGFFFIQCISYVMAAVLIAILVKRGGLAIGIYFLYSLILENVLKFFMNARGGTAGRYLPLQSTDELIPFPVLENLQKKVLAPSNTTVLFLLALAYLAAYVILSIRKFETDDL